jgi:hypothetical protein
VRVLGTSWLGNAGYRSYEGVTRVEMIEAATAAAALGRRRDGMELHVREVEGDEADGPPRLLLVPRGS